VINTDRRSKDEKVDNWSGEKRAATKRFFELRVVPRGVRLFCGKFCVVAESVLDRGPTEDCWNGRWRLSNDSTTRDCPVC